MPMVVQAAWLNPMYAWPSMNTAVWIGYPMHYISNTIYALHKNIRWLLLSWCKDHSHVAIQFTDWSQFLDDCDKMVTSFYLITDYMVGPYLQYYSSKPWSKLAYWSKHYQWYIPGLLVMKPAEYLHNEVKGFISTGSLLSIASICTE